jgi:hypothetical protein
MIYRFQLQWNLTHLTIQSTFKSIQTPLLFKIHLKFSTQTSLLSYSLSMFWDSPVIKFLIYIIFKYPRTVRRLMSELSFYWHLRLQRNNFNDTLFSVTEQYSLMILCLYRQVLHRAYEYICRSSVTDVKWVLQLR